MHLLHLIKFNKPVYTHYSNPDAAYTIKCTLRLAKEQGVLPEICQRLGISLRSAQRWIPTPKIEFQTLKQPPKRKFIPLIPYPPEYETKKRKRKNAKRKSLHFNKSIQELLYRVFINNEPIPDVEPTDEEILLLLKNYKESGDSWKKVSEELRVNKTTLLRLIKTGRLRKSHRILLFISLVDVQ
jgi:hypothetical protein